MDADDDDAVSDSIDSLPLPLSLLLLFHVWVLCNNAEIFRSSWSSYIGSFTCADGILRDRERDRERDLLPSDGRIYSISTTTVFFMYHLSRYIDMYNNTFLLYIIRDAHALQTIVFIDDNRFCDSLRNLGYIFFISVCRVF